MSSVSIVVLHYKVFSVTSACIECLLKQNYKDYHIIVIDNYSNNGSLEILIEKYKNNQVVEFICMERNYGFAKSNNVGYLIAKHKYNSEIIIIMNNDVMIDDVMFFEKIINKYSGTDFGIIGPDIENMIGEHQNPIKKCIMSKREVDRRLFVNRMKIITIPFLYRILKGKKIPNLNNIPQNKIGVPLHGACLIFANPFIYRHEYAFYPETFLFAEEELLFYLSNRNAIKMIYDPELKVRHLEDCSTKSVIRDDIQRRLFELKNSNDSLRILRKLMIEDN